MASSKNIHLTFMSINFYVHNQQTLLKVNSLSIKIPIEMMKSNFNVRQGETLQNKSKHHQNIKPKALREFKSICVQALRLKDTLLSKPLDPFIKKNKGEILNKKSFLTK